ncbi:MAG: right-handed parallel beta-helix repeat-containing protein [Planctomycetes bacterium]|nr:right-handed parallel beta-helix repeat-containing protein [Planctomycetota bacterium]
MIGGVITYDVEPSSFRSLLILALSLSIIASANATARAETILVRSDYETIQEAIDAASDGDTILVEVDLFFENIDFLGKSILVQSTDGAEFTIIDGSALTLGDDFGAVVTFASGEGQDAVLDGFMLQGGIGNIHFAPVGELRLGGGSYCLGSSPSIRNCVISDNENSGIFAADSGILIEDCHISENTAAVGAGISVSGQSPCMILRCTIEGNEASFLSVGVWLPQPLDPWNSPTAVMEDCVISGNSSGIYGGGLSAHVPVEIRRCAIVGNDAGLGAGGLFLSYEYFVSECIVSGNTADSGAAFILGNDFGGVTPVIERCIIAENVAAVEGGAIYVDSGTTTIQITNCTLTDNVAPSGGAIFNRITPFAAEAEFEIENCILWSNGMDALMEGEGSIVASYSDVEGGYPGEGNIDADPLFGAPDDGEYYLLDGSPCIDAGNPLSALDADGSIADMGAIPYPFTNLDTAQFGQSEFMRGDASGDGSVDTLVDVLYLLGWQYSGSSAPPCMDADDADDDGIVNALLDSFYLLAWQFNGGLAPPAPGTMSCGIDSTQDALDCNAHLPCN